MTELYAHCQDGFDDAYCMNCGGEGYLGLARHPDGDWLDKPCPVCTGSGKASTVAPYAPVAKQVKAPAQSGHVAGSNPAGGTLAITPHHEGSST